MQHQDWVDVAAAACAHAGIDYAPVEIIATWDQLYCANAIYRLDDGHFLKVFGPTAQVQFHCERAALQLLAGHPAIPVPRIIASGEPAHAPPYLVLSAIPGETAERVWDDLSRADQLRLARDIGAITATIHQLPVDALAAVACKFGAYDARIRWLQARFDAQIAALELPSPRHRNALQDFVYGEVLELLNLPKTVTHFDLAHNHIYLAQSSGRWVITGLIDWGDALPGPPTWDIAYLWFWTFSRDREAMRACLETLYADTPMPDHFARRCLAATVYTPSMSLLWPEFVERGFDADCVGDALTTYFFPADVFGPPD